MSYPNAQTDPTSIQRHTAARHGVHDPGVEARPLHEPAGVYEQCRCDPAEIDYVDTHFVVDGVGLTCDRGLLFHVCAICCADDVDCSQQHSHGPAAPACARTHAPAAVAS